MWGAVFVAIAAATGNLLQGWDNATIAGCPQLENDAWSSFYSLVYFGLTLFYLPESPRWLVSKGRMAEAKKVQQRLPGQEDVSGEMALPFEGLGVGGEASLEELYGQEDGRASMLEGRASMIAKSVTGQANLGLMSRQGSLLNPNVHYVDPLVNLFGSVHEKLLPENTGSMCSLLNLQNMGSILNMGRVLNVALRGRQDKMENWDLEGNGNAADFEDNVRRPLLSGQKSASMVNDMMPSKSNSLFGMRHNSSLMLGTSGEAVSSMDIGGGWALAYKYSEKVGKDGKKTEEYQRVYLHQEGALES
ncbi:hypothetical protein PS2_026528 [Malus domestica]